jgi:hypothetical protein
MLAMLEGYVKSGKCRSYLIRVSIQALQLRDYSEIKFPQLTSVPLLRDCTPGVLSIRLSGLKRGYIQKHGQPPDFATLLQGLIEKARQMSDKPRKRKGPVQEAPSDEVGSTSKAGKPNQHHKSAEFVSTSDEEEDEDS